MKKTGENANGNTNQRVAVGQKWKFSNGKILTIENITQSQCGLPDNAVFNDITPTHGLFACEPVDRLPTIAKLIDDETADFLNLLDNPELLKNLNAAQKEQFGDFVHQNSKYTYYSHCGNYSYHILESGHGVADVHEWGEDSVYPPSEAQRGLEEFLSLLFFRLS